MTYTTTNTVRTLIEMFIDGTSGEVYNSGRLATVPTENGVRLVAYGNEVLAEVREKKVILFTGHHGEVSKTVTGYIKTLGSALNDFEEREVEVRPNESPTLGIGARASKSAQYIGSYYPFNRDPSNVDQMAAKEVRSALQERMNAIFG